MLNKKLEILKGRRDALKGLVDLSAIYFRQYP